MINFVNNQAKDDFNRARNRALINELQNFLAPDKKKLLSFHDVKKILKPQNEVYVGMKSVPINKIIGSEGRYRDFDNHFLPRSGYLRQRWERVDQAHLTDIPLPPIQLYEIGGMYFVRDGNHRVSVAKAQGVEFIDAEIISLKSEIVLPSSVTPETILDEVIKYEKRVFYTETGFGDLTEDWNLDFTSPGQYDVIYNHILVHKYYINETIQEEIPFPDAMLSWYQNVYQPVLRVIRKKKLLKKFRKRTESDLYVWIIKRWDELKNKYGDSFPLDEATRGIDEPEVLPFPASILQKIKNFFQT
ncbi:MAG TPA: transcriptional regulator [Treponemataceae bacterium]|nr:transcriptional regulator [Treponemataceae bacterium]